MDSLRRFTPPLQPGTTIQGLAATLLGAVAAAFYYRAALLPVGGRFLAFLMLAVLFTLPIPFLLYGLYALHHASYSLDRDRLVLQWGWWVEEIPMQAIVAAQPVAAEEASLPLPRIRWPGMLIGQRQADNTAYIFMAAQPGGLVVIATETRRFVLSPSEPGAFLEALRRAAEEGSLEAPPAASQKPGHWVRQIWNDLPARLLLILAWAATAGALVWSNLAASGLTQTPQAAPVAIDRAVLLSVASWLFQGMNFGLGLFAYQSQNRRPMAYLIWLVGALSALGFLASVGMLLLGGSA